MKVEIESSVISMAVKGNKSAIELLISHVQKDIFNIAIRFLFISQDAEDATQEILIKIITHLSTFKGKSSFNTWAYRIAVNYLLNTKKTNAEKKHFSLNEFSSYLNNGLDEVEYDLPDKDLLAMEVKLSCSTGLLLCLNRSQRIAYILGEVFEVDSFSGAAITNTTQENFRKRLSIARTKVRNFMNAHCGIINSQNKCRCEKRIHAGLKSNRLNPEQLNFVSRASQIEVVRQVHQLINVSEFYKSHPQYQASNKIVDEIKKLITSNKFSVFED